MEIYITSSAFIVAGILHFMFPSAYKKIMPPYIPAHYFMIYVSGFLEVLGGVLLLFTSTQAFASIGLSLLLIAVFPANLYMAQRMQKKESRYAWLAWLRLPFQVVLIAWMIWLIP